MKHRFWWLMCKHLSKLFILGTRDLSLECKGRRREVQSSRGSSQSPRGAQWSWGSQNWGSRGGKVLNQDFGGEVLLNIDNNINRGRCDGSTLDMLKISSEEEEPNFGRFSCPTLLIIIIKHCKLEFFTEPCLSSAQ